jgi:hypothetical protein
VRRNDRKCHRRRTPSPHAGQRHPQRHVLRPIRRWSVRGDPADRSGGLICRSSVSRDRSGNRRQRTRPRRQRASVRQGPGTAPADALSCTDTHQRSLAPESIRWVS